MVDLTGRTALVTGGGSGIGLAIVHRLVAAGAAVTVVDLPTSPAHASHAQVRFVGADLTDAHAVGRVAAEAGPVDILINNAGFQHVSPIESFPVDQWQRMIALMLTAPFILTRALLPGMYERDFGRVINIASVHGLVASQYKSAYVSAKHGLLGFTKALALEAGEHGQNVTAHAVCPSYVRTPLVERQIEDQARVHGIPSQSVIEDVLLERNAVKRLIEPEEVAEAVIFLCGNSSWTMSGTALRMDAGWLAH